MESFPQFFYDKSVAFNSYDEWFTSLEGKVAVIDQLLSQVYGVT